MDDSKICLCSRCIDAIKSRGEKVYVGSTMEFELDDDVAKCDWCNEEYDTDELYDCLI